MRKLTIMLAVLLFVPVLAHAQVDFSAWPNVVLGAQYLPADQVGKLIGPADFRPLVTANVVGPHTGNFAIGGMGFGFSAEATNSIKSLALSVPLATYYPKGKSLLLQVGLSKFLNGNYDFGYYVAVGWSKAPAAVAAKRAARKAAGCK